MAPGHQIAITPTALRVEVAVGGQTVAKSDRGEASYWSVEVGGEVRDDLVWSCEDPIPEAKGIAGLMCFDSERADIVVEGQAQS